MRLSVPLVAFGTAILTSAVLAAQGATPQTPATYITAAEVTTRMQKSGINGAGQILQVFANQTVRRRNANEPNNASVHPNHAETYHILEGSGVLTTGGSLPDEKNRSAGITGGVSKDVKPGDWIVIPAGTTHWFSKINGSILYVETRLYPGNKGAE